MAASATASATAAATAQTVMNHVKTLSAEDPDFRYMSLNDLLQLLTTAKHDIFLNDYGTAARTIDSVTKTLDDQNGEVQNLAIKCIGPLVEKLAPSLFSSIIDRLSALKLINSVDNAIPCMALRQAIMALPQPIPGLPPSVAVMKAYEAISHVLIPRIIGTGQLTTQTPATDKEDGETSPCCLSQNKKEATVEAVDVVIEVVRCFGPLLDQTKVKALVQVVSFLLESDRTTSVVKKRAVVAISMLAVYLHDESLNAMLKRFMLSLAHPNVSPVFRRLFISILGSMARSIPARFGAYLPETAPLIFNALAQTELNAHLEKLNDGDDVDSEFNEVREVALVALEAFLASCPQQMRPFTDTTIDSCLRYLKYDPNYAADDDEEMEDDVDEEEEDQDEDDEFDADDGFEDDDDDTSWRVRRFAAKAMYTLIATRGSGDLLETGVLYKTVAPMLIKCMNDREENVRLEIISALSLLVRKTGEALHIEALTSDDLEPDTVTQAPVSRKRRRQSSGGGSSLSRFMASSGLVSPVQEKSPPIHGPRAELSALTPSIVRLSTKHLKGKTIPTKQAVIELLDDLVSVLRGGLADYFDFFMSPVLDTVKPIASFSVTSSLATARGTAMATPSTLRIMALKFISDITKTHSSTLLQPHLAQIVTGVTSAVNDDFYKISSEALRTSEELIKAITPPRLQGSASKHRAQLEKLYSVMMDRACANDADAEVRRRAIHGIGVLIARTSTADGDSLLPTNKHKDALDALRDRLKNETTRLAAVRAIDNVAAFANNPGQLDETWIQDVALELAGQLRMANRSLRFCSILALKNLVICKAADGKLAPQTIERIVSVLMPIILNPDDHLLGVSLLILADIARNHVHLVLNLSSVKALCILLKLDTASIVLDQLLVFIGAIGVSGASSPLMKSILQNVSTKGDSVVVGKVIGTLLATGGESSGVSVDSFISELSNYAQDGYEERACLALAVLGEVGMKLGANSPLQPDLFRGQFHDEPDRISLAAAAALGRAGSGNVPVFLPVILKEMDKGGNTQYLLIQSIREILQSVSSQATDLRDRAITIWDPLLKASANADNRVVCAECVGRIVTLDPAVFMPKLQALLKDESTGVRGMAVQAVRYMLPECDEAFDAVLRNVLIDMLLVMLQDPDMEIRRLAMTTLNSAAHNKPEIILPQLGQLMPFVLVESVIKPELVREVMLGPFKHTVDDGLEVRKSAYETLYALMETAFSRINNIDLFDRVIAGLKDDNDIRQLCNLMLTKLMVIDADETTRRLDSIAEAFRSVLSTRLKENAVKQDMEKQQETQKSILRVTLLLGAKMKTVMGNAGAATSNAGAASVWASYWEWVNRNWEEQVTSLRDENQELLTKMV